MIRPEALLHATDLRMIRLLRREFEIALIGALVSLAEYTTLEKFSQAPVVSLSVLVLKAYLDAVEEAASASFYQAPGEGAAMGRHRSRSQEAFRSC